MRVIVNQLVALGLKTGIGHYTDQLLRCLREQAGEDRIDSFPTGWVRRACEVIVRARPSLNAGAHAEAGKSQPWLSRLRSDAVKGLRQAGLHVVGRHFRRLCARQNYDVYHEPNFIPLASDRPTVATLHDLSVLLHPEWHPAERVAHFERHFTRSLDRTTHFLTVSEFIRQEVITTLGVAPERVTCIYNGVRPEFTPLPEAEVAPTLARLGLPPRFLLYVGTIEPRKNVLPLLRAYCDLPAALRDRWPLLLAGSWGWNAQPVADYLESVGRHRGVIHLGYLADQHLAAVYNGARALIYPSLYEGFGLPPLEMMACGGAVLASTAGALVEMFEGQAHLVPSDDVAGWRQALIRVVTDDEWWQSLRRGAEAVARPYTWDRCAADTLRVYRSLCGRTEKLGQDLPNQRRAG